MIEDLPERGAFEPVDTAADDVAIIAFTSGTTGAPKGCVHFHRDLLACCDTFARAVLDPRSTDVFSGTPPIAFTFGLGASLLFPLRFGASVAPVARPGELLDVAARARGHDAVHRADRVPGAARRDVPGSLHTCVSAGEPLPAGVAEAWYEQTGIRIVDGIGSTEMLHIFIASPAAEARPGSCGRPVPGYEARIVGADMQTLPPGSVGKLAVRGPTGCRYLDDERQSVYVRDGWNLTGDAFSMDEDGYFWFQARTDDMIISSGYNISGFEVEAALLEHPAVAECAVVAAPDEERGHVVMAYVVAGESVSVGELQDHVKAPIAPYKYPRRIEFVDALPAHADGQGPAQRAAGAGVVRALQPPGWPTPRGYANGIEASGRLVFVGGQIGWDAVGRVRRPGSPSRSARRWRTSSPCWAEAGAGPEHVARLTWYVVDREDYLAQQKEIGVAYRSVMGRHFPAMAVVQVVALVEAEALVEIEATAVLRQV